MVYGFNEQLVAQTAADIAARQMGNATPGNLNWLTQFVIKVDGDVPAISVNKPGKGKGTAYFFDPVTESYLVYNGQDGQPLVIDPIWNGTKQKIDNGAFCHWVLVGGAVFVLPPDGMVDFCQRACDENCDPAECSKPPCEASGGVRNGFSLAVSGFVDDGQGGTQSLLNGTYVFKADNAGNIADITVPITLGSVKASGAHPSNPTWPWVDCQPGGTIDHAANVIISPSTQCNPQTGELEVTGVSLRFEDPNLGNTIAPNSSIPINSTGASQCDSTHTDDVLNGGCVVPGTTRQTNSVTGTLSYLPADGCPTECCGGHCVGIQAITAATIDVDGFVGWSQVGISTRLTDCSWRVTMRQSNPVLDRQATVTLDATGFHLVMEGISMNQSGAISCTAQNVLNTGTGAQGCTVTPVYGAPCP